MPGALPWSVLAVAAGALVLVAVLLVVVISVPKMATDPNGFSHEQWSTHVDTLRGHILQALGGLGLFGTLYFSARTLRLGRRGQLSDRFSKAVDQLGQLGPGKLAVRLGGIYALEQIALDSEEMHWPVMEVLTAFMRNTRLAESVESPPWVIEESINERDRAPLRADLQAIAYVLGRRPGKRRRWERERELVLPLRFAQLPRIRWRRAHLEWARLIGAHLEHANLAYAHLENARLRMAFLRSADLQGAHLEGARLRGARLEGADLTGAHLADADLTGAHLEGAILRRVHDLTPAQLASAHIDASTILPQDIASESMDPDPCRGGL